MGLKADHVPWVPSNGAAPAMQDLAAGGIDIVTCSVPEARAMIDAGKARSLAVMAPERNPAFKDVPTLKEAAGHRLLGRRLARHRRARRACRRRSPTKLTAALKKVYDSKEFKDFMSNRGFGMVWGDAAQFAKFMDDGNTKMGDAMKAAGRRRLAKSAAMSDFHLSRERGEVNGDKGSLCVFPIVSRDCFSSSLARLRRTAGGCFRRCPASPSVRTCFLSSSASGSRSAG